jgi:hypothetical protein
MDKNEDKNFPSGFEEMSCFYLSVNGEMVNPVGLSAKIAGEKGINGKHIITK